MSSFIVELISWRSSGGVNNFINGEAYKYEIYNTFGNIFCKTENNKPSMYWYSTDKLRGIYI